MPEILHQEEHPAQEARGVKGQKIIEGFTKKVFPSLVEEIESTEQFDANDLNGVDSVWRIRTEKGIKDLAVDETDPDEQTRRAKIKRLQRMPCVFLHDENGRPTTELMPRILLNYRLGYFLSLKERAERNGKEGVFEVMTAQERKKQRNEELDQIIKQMELLSGTDVTYKKLAEPILKAFKKERTEK